MMRRKRLFSLLAFLTLLISLTIAMPIVHGDGAGPQGFSVPEKQEQHYPNLGSQLNQLVAAFESGRLSPQIVASDSLLYSGESVAVTIHLSSNVDGVVNFLENNGGDPRNIGEDYIEAYVPVTLLGELSEQPGVTRLQEIIPPEPSYGEYVSQGVQTHLSQAWNNAGYSGQGVKVGVIDLGFYGLSSVMGTELPTNIRGMCYTDMGEFSHDLSDCDVVDEVPEGYPPQCIEAAQRRAPLNAVHGTAVSEAVIDIAPEVSLYVANPFSRADMQDVVQWMASEGVSVINYSASYTFDGPGDGTSPSSVSPLNTVDQAVANDILFVTSAGNSADNAWFGDYSDPDGDRAISFGGQNDEVIDFPLRECRTFSFQLRWEDNWDGANTDLNLHLYHKPSGSIVRSSDAEQSGRSGDIPFERLPLLAFADSEDFGIVVFHRGGPIPDWIQLVYWGPGSIEHYTVNGSIGNPAESANPGMLAVCATHYWDTHTIADYSSQGPTPDGRVKPDIVGTACAETVSYPRYLRGGQECWFSGTSQASPHVAGLAALVKQQFPGFTPAQVAGYLKSNAEQRESPDPNNTWGHGFAVLPPPGGCDAVDIAAEGSLAQGTWANDCQSQEAAGRNARYYQFTLAEESEVTITLESDDGAQEPVLHLRQGADATSGDYIGFNEGESESSYLRAVIEQNLDTGTYTIEARTYSEGYEGSFTLAVSVAGGCTVAEIAADGSAVSGTWAADCESQEREGRYARYYQFTLTESADVSVLLESADAETVLYLREGADATSGATVPGGFNEGDAPDYHSASIEQRLEAGTYTIEATTYAAGESGDFTLTVGEPGDGCVVADVATDGSEVSGTWANDCKSEEKAGRNARYYQFTLEGSAEVSVLLESSNAETVLYLREGEGVTSGDYIGFNEGESEYSYRRAVIEQTLSAGIYTIEATTYSAGETGDFTLTVGVPGGVPGLSDCIAQFPSYGPVTGQWDPDCESQVRSGRYARYYTFTLAQAGEVTIALASEEAETVLYLREGADATSGGHIGFHDGESPDYHRAVIERTLEAGTYTIEATTYSAGETGSFTLALTFIAYGNVSLPVAVALAPLGDNLLWVARFDNATNMWSVYDPSGTFSLSELPPNQTGRPYSDSIGDLTHLRPGDICWIKVAQAQTATLGGVIESLNEGINLIVFGQ